VPPGDAQQASSNRAAPQAPAPHPTSPAAPIAERQAPRTTRQARDPAFAEASTTSSSTVRPLRSKNEQRPVLSANRLPSRQPRFGIQRRWPRAQRARITRWKTSSRRLPSTIDSALFAGCELPTRGRPRAPQPSTNAACCCYLSSRAGAPISGRPPRRRATASARVSSSGGKQYLVPGFRCCHRNRPGR